MLTHARLVKIISCYTILSNSPLGIVSKKNINPIHFSTKTHFSIRGVLTAKDMTLKQKQNWLKASYFQLQRRGKGDTVSHTATRSFWISLLPWGCVFLNLPLKGQHPALLGGCGCVEGGRRHPGPRNALEWQPSWLWWEQGSMASARLGAFRECLWRNVRKSPSLAEMLRTEKWKLNVETGKIFFESRNIPRKRLMKPFERIFQENVSCA